MKIKSLKSIQISMAQMKLIKGGSDSAMAIEKIEIATEKIEVVM